MGTKQHLTEEQLKQVKTEHPEWFNTFKENDWVVWSGNGACIAQIYKRNDFEFDGETSECYVLKNMIGGKDLRYTSCNVKYLRLATDGELLKSIGKSNLIRELDERLIEKFQEGYNQGYSDAKQQEPDFNV